MSQKKSAASKKSSAPKIQDLSVKQRRLALIKQKQCDEIALNIVKKLIDCPVEDDVFLQCLKYLNQCHFQDIVEERAISKMCGYPICGQKIPDMPTKTYHISGKSNKVYDITDRKNYCSNYCYKAGIFIKEQLLTSPLWFRDREVIPDFHLLLKTEKGIPGQEIDQGIIRIDKENENNNFTSVSTFAQDMINEMPDNVCDETELETKQTLGSEYEHFIPNNSYFCNKYFTPSLTTIFKQNADYFQNESKQKTETVNNNNNHTEVENDKKFDDDDNNNTNKLEAVKVNQTSSKMKSILSKPKQTNDKKKTVTFSPYENVKEIPISENKIEYKKPIIIDKNDNNNKNIKHINLLGSVHEKSNSYKSTENKTETIKQNNEEKKNRLKNSATYKKTNLMSKSKPIKEINKLDEMKINKRLEQCVKEWTTFETLVFLYGEEYVKQIVSEDVFQKHLNDKKGIEMNQKQEKQYNAICNRINLMELADKKYDQSVTGKERRSVPSYEELRDQSEEMDLKVKAFYSGCYELIDDEESETESVKDEDEPYIVKGPPAVLPLLDSKDTGATRKRIFLTSLGRSFPFVCDVLKLSPNVIFSNMKELVDTFKFKSDNIVFRTKEWQLVAIILIKLLSIQDKDLKNVLDSQYGQFYLKSLGKEFQIEDEDQELFLTSDTLIVSILENCMKDINKNY